MIRIRGKLFGVLTVILVLIIVFCVKGTVMSRENAERGQQNRCYAVLEQEYLDRTQQLLEEEGLTGCGMNLRWVADVDGSREYTILLHHKKLDRMTEEERSVLTDMLTEMEFQDEACSFRYKIFYD